MVSVLRRGIDNDASSANTQETAITPALVRTRGVTLLRDLVLPGDARGAEAQVLVADDILFEDGSRHRLAIVATMANSVLAYDDATGALVWSRVLGPPIDRSGAIDAHPINDHWGILSTPVIDGGIVYLVAWISPDGDYRHGTHWACALHLADGSAAKPPLNLEGAQYIPVHGQTPILFASAERKQRASLAMTRVGDRRGVVIPFGSLQENNRQTSRGWVIIVDADAWDVDAAWTVTTSGFGGGIWQAGAAPVIEADGGIVMMSGNGDFDGALQLSNSVFRLRWTPRAGNDPGTLKAVAHWTPYTDDGITGAGLDPGGADDETPTPSNRRAYAEADAAGRTDQDFGSSGPTLVRVGDSNLLVCCGKIAIGYVVNANDMGDTRPADLENPAINYAKLKQPPLWFTAFPGFQSSPAPRYATDLPLYVNGKTAHLHGNVVAWESAAHGWMIFVWGENNALRAFTLDATGLLTFIASSDETASPNSGGYGGMPGGMITLSANGKQDGILWASVPWDDANMGISPGRLLAYDATNFAPRADGSQRLVPIWDSADWGWQFSHNKFNRPTPANGRVYVPTYDGTIKVVSCAPA